MYSLSYALLVGANFRLLKKKVKATVKLLNGNRGFNKRSKKQLMNREISKDYLNL